MQEGILFITDINESGIQTGHDFLHFPVIDVTYRKFNASLLRCQLYQPLVL